MMAKPCETYLKLLLLHYEEEVEGEACFSELAARFADADQWSKLDLLAQVEAHAAKAVEPLIEKYGLIPRSAEDLARVGKSGARIADADWERLLVEMSDAYPGYVDDFKRLEQMGPPEDRPRLSVLTEHEVAAVEFLALESTAPAESTVPLRAHLGRQPETWRVDRA